MSAKVLVWVASVGRQAQLTKEAHYFFYDRYTRLARCHRSRGHQAKAQRFADMANVHYRAAGGLPDGPPYAAAMAMPRPSRFVTSDAVSRRGFDDPDDAA